MSSDSLHPADFLYQLAYAIKAVRARGGKWNKTADTIQWAHERIERLERELERLRSRLDIQQDADGGQHDEIDRLRAALDWEAFEAEQRLQLWRGECGHHWIKSESPACPICRLAEIDAARDRHEAMRRADRMLDALAIAALPSSDSGASR